MIYEDKKIQEMDTIFEAKKLDLWYGSHHALKSIDLKIDKKSPQ